MTATSDAFKEIVPPLLHPPCSRSNIRRCLRWRGILITFNEEMCGRHRTTSEEELARLYHISIPSQTDLPISYNIAPSQKVLTIRFNPQTQQRSLGALQWGLIPFGRRLPCGPDANVGNFCAGKQRGRMMIHRSGNPFMQGQQRRRTMRLKFCASRNVFSARSFVRARQQAGRSHKPIDNLTLLLYTFAMQTPRLLSLNSAS
jgi:hypothetical protein